MEKTTPLGSITIGAQNGMSSILQEYQRGRALHQFLKRLPSLDSIKPRSGNMQTRATITTFMAAIQAQILSVTVSQNSSALQTALNVLGFSGLIMQILVTAELLEISVLLQWTERRIRGYLEELKERPVEEMMEFVGQLNGVTAYTQEGSPPFRRSVLNEAIKIFIARAKKPTDESPPPHNHAGQTNAVSSQIPSLDLQTLINEVQVMERPPDLEELVALGDTLHREWVAGDHVNWWWLITTCQFLVTVMYFAATSEKKVVWVVTLVAFLVLLAVLLWFREHIYAYRYKLRHKQER